MDISIILNYLTNNFSPVSLSISSIAICSLIIFLLALKHNEINEKLAKKDNKIKIFAVNMIMLSITIILLISFFKISKYFMQTIDVEIYRLSIFHIIISLLILVLFNMHWNFVVDQVIKKVETKKDYTIKMSFKFLNFLISLYLTFISPLIITFFIGFFYLSNLILQCIFIKEVINE